MQPHEERVVNELAELSEKKQRLETFLITPLCRSLPMDEQHRLARQILIMRLYIDVLQERIEHFPGSQGSGTTST